MLKPATLLAALADLTRWLNAERIPGAIIGGVAASILGRPRTTRDVDALVLLDDGDWSDVVATAAAHGIVPRIDDAIEFAGRTRVLLLRHAPSGTDLDLSIGGLAFERELIARARTVTIGGTPIALATPEDLVIMKMLARRSRDLGDVEAVLDVQADLDVARIREWLREFSAALDTPEIHEDFERLLSRRRRVR